MSLKDDPRISPCQLVPGETRSVAEEPGINYTHTGSFAMLIDDILSEVMSHLVPSEAARAGRVSIQWYHHSLRPAYSHVILHAVSQPALLLAETLHDSPPLRALVRHLTVIARQMNTPNRLYSVV